MISDNIVKSSSTGLLFIWTKVLAKNVGKTPAPLLPDDEETATVVIDVVAELEERLAAEEDTTVLP